MSEKLNVKVGDKVVLSYPGSDYRVIDDVIRVTPSGRIKIARNSSKTFSAEGVEMRSDRWAPRARLYILTPELEAEIHDEKVIRKCLLIMHKTQKITYEQAAAIMEILKAATPSEGDTE